jgi:hypothetical protein
MAHVPLGGSVMHRAAELARQFKLRGADAVHMGVLGINGTKNRVNDVRCATTRYP